MSKKEKKYNIKKTVDKDGVEYVIVEMNKGDKKEIIKTNQE